MTAPRSGSFVLGATASDGEIASLLVAIEQHVARIRVLMAGRAVQPPQMGGMNYAAPMPATAATPPPLFSFNAGAVITDRVAFVWRSGLEQGRDATLALLRRTYPRVTFELIAPGDLRRFSRTIYGVWLNTERSPSSSEVVELVRVRSGDGHIATVSVMFRATISPHQDALQYSFTNFVGEATVVTTDPMGENPTSFAFDRRKEAIDRLLML